MLKTVHRTEIALVDEQIQELRGFLRILHVAPHRNPMKDALEVWFEVADFDDVHRVKFFVHGTGHTFDHPHAEYVGTCPTHNGALIWHVYAQWPIPEEDTDA